MSIVHCSTSSDSAPQEIPLPAETNSKPLQRLAKARRLQGISRRAMARRLNIEVEQVRQQEEAMADLTLGTIYAWQKALDVPVAELLVEADDSLTSPILERSRLVRLMKTVLAIRQQAKQQSIRRMADTMVAQLIEIMPELANVSPWPIVGKRRRLNDMGIITQRRLSDDVFVDTDE
jgi:transcriptional regulator with XRE-family HTH domain